MTRSYPILAGFALLLGACAPAQTATAPATSPAPSAPTTVAPPVAEPDAALAAAGDRWWLLDEQTNRIPGISADRSYQELLAGKQPRQPVVVAIIDSGVDISHEDLDDNVWTNEDEIPGNNIDDDRNGYVDDVHGWNFIGGPGGRNVAEDTYELTRLYAAGRARFGGPNPDTLSVAGKAAYREFEQVSTEFETKRAEAVQSLSQIRQIETVVDGATALLKEQLGTDSLTAARVASIRTDRPDVLRAKEIYQQLAANGATPELVRKQREYFESRVEYGLNPEFNPRGIVGDNPADLTERFYGNNDVQGPDAEHGTHVAGIVAAERNNGIGVDGIASAARIMSVRAVPDGDERDKDVANAIRYAVDNGARVINMSFGKGHSPGKTAVDDAVRYAEQKGVLLVHAAGNDAADLDTEANFPNRYFARSGSASNWIEVGASAQALDSLAAPFSNYSSTRVDVFAPGMNILSTVPHNRYEANSGTSMAAPVVSGLAALIWSYYPDLTATQIKQIILDSTARYADQAVVRPGGEGARIPFGQLSATGGVVNAYQALQRAAQESP